MIKSLVVENESKHSKHLLNLLAKHFPEIEVLALCETIPDAVKKVSALKPELVFLDVELSPYTGFDLLEQTKNLTYEVIFTTSHNKYAVKAIKFSALDFIEKPFGIEELKEGIDRYKARKDNGSQRNQVNVLLDNIKQKKPVNQKIIVPVKNGFDAVQISELILCSGQDSGTVFYLTGKNKLWISKSMKWTEELLHETDFFRTHDSHLINLHHIKQIRHVREGAEVFLTDGWIAEVSKRKKAEFLYVIEKMNICKT